MCVTSLLCGPRANLWPFYGFLCKRFSLYIKVYQGWTLQRSDPTDPPKENGRKFAPTAPIASKFRLGDARQFSFPFVILLRDAFASRANQRSQISATFPVRSHRQNLGLNYALPLKDSDIASQADILRRASPHGERKKIFNNVLLKFHHFSLKMPKIVEIAYTVSVENPDSKTYTNAHIDRLGPPQMLHTSGYFISSRFLDIAKQ